jgi:hypothetical protein
MNQMKLTLDKIKSVILLCLLTVAALTVHSTLLLSQTVYSVKYANQADIKVYIVKYESQADLIVHKVKYANQVNSKGLWFFTDYPNQAKKKIFFVEYPNQADLKIYFTEYSNKAQWRNKSKEHLVH